MPKKTKISVISEPLWSETINVPEKTHNAVKSAKNSKTDKKQKQNKNVSNNSNTNASSDRVISNRISDEKNKKTKSSSGVESRRTQDTGKKSNVSNETDKKRGNADEVRKDRNIKGKDDSFTKDTSTVVKKSVRKGVGQHTVIDGKGKGNPTESTSKCDSGVKKSPAKTGRGKSKTADGRKEQSIGINYSDYPKGEFQDSTFAMPKRQLMFPERKTSDESVVEIILDEKRYLVSRWSVIDGYYIQGLDSRFIVSKLHIK